MLEYRVGVFREAGLEAKWSRTRQGAPIIAARHPDVGGGKWYAMDARMWERAAEVGVKQAFEEHVCLGHIFSI